MKKVQALIDLGLITVDDVWDYAMDMQAQAYIDDQLREQQYTQADYEADSAHNEVLPF